VKPNSFLLERSDLLARDGFESDPACDGLWGVFLSEGNLLRALKRVEANKGAPGVDGMQTSQLWQWLREHWPQVKCQLQAGIYRPQALRRVQIPKPNGKTRVLGVPTVLDRLVQQALLQVLSPIFDPYFHQHSYGFRPQRSAHQAVEHARKCIEDGNVWVVDIDLDSFFDRVCHDKLMAKVARKIRDKRVLRLVRSFLNAGIMTNSAEEQVGTPQGSALSPLLGNVMLDDLDWELHNRGHAFARYADDIVIYVRSQRAAKRVMHSITRFVHSRLKLVVNESKSQVLPFLESAFLGFGFCTGEGNKVRIKVDPKAARRVKHRLKKLTGRSYSISMDKRIAQINRFVRGWAGYFAYADTPSPFRNLDKWLRRRLRSVCWKQWKLPIARKRNLRRLGIAHHNANRWGGSSKGHWRIAQSLILTQALPNAYWTGQGLKGFLQNYHYFRGSAT
jgi:RNA-directed DNA polymerase